MINIKKKISVLNLNERWFAESIAKTDFFKVTTLRKYLGKRPKFMIEDVSYTLELNLSLSDDEIFSAFKSNNRNEIRKAEKLDFRFKINSISIEEYVGFYNKFAEAKGLSLISGEQLELYNLSNLTFFCSYDTNLDLLVAHAYLNDGKTVRLLHSSSQIHDMDDKEKRKIIGFFNRKLHWEAMKFFKSKSFQVYDWGGLAKDTENRSLQGINSFKKSFGGEEVKVYNYNSLLFAFLLKLHSFLKN